MFVLILLPLKNVINNFIELFSLKLSNKKFKDNSNFTIKLINSNIIFFKTFITYVFQFDTSFRLFKCTVENYYIYSITLNYNKVFLNTRKYKFTSIFTRE